MRLLEGVRVVGFTTALAGPSTLGLLAMMGAEVIKLESRTALGTRVDSRTDRSQPGYLERNTWFLDMHVGTKSFAVNLKTKEGVGIVRRLIRETDVVVSNFRPEVLKRIGLDYDALRAIRPDLVMVSLSYVGQTGPEAHLPGVAILFGARSGAAMSTGYADGPPTEHRVENDLRLVFDLFLAVSTGLYHRDRTGEGSFFDVSAVEAHVCRRGDYVLDYQITGAVQPRRGNAHAIAAPHECYPCKGERQWVSIAVSTDKEWAALCGAIGRPELAQPSSPYAAAAGRRARLAEVDAVVAEWTRGLTKEEATARLQAAGVAAFPVMSVKDIAEDPHLRERGLITTVSHPVVGEWTTVGAPWRSSGPDREVVRRAPLFGEHVDDIAARVLGMGAEEIEDLKRRHILE